MTCNKLIQINKIATLSSELNQIRLRMIHNQMKSVKKGSIMTSLDSCGKNLINVMHFMEFDSLNCRYSKIAIGNTQEYWFAAL